MPFAVASMVSPSGMTLAGKYGIGVLSIASMTTEGIQALPRSGASPRSRQPATAKPSTAATGGS